MDVLKVRKCTNMHDLLTCAPGGPGIAKKVAPSLALLYILSNENQLLIQQIVQPILSKIEYYI